MRLRLQVFAKHLATVHVPRRFYTQVLPGIPTIRVFEALAWGYRSFPHRGTIASICSALAKTS